MWSNRWLCAISCLLLTVTLTLLTDPISAARTFRFDPSAPPKNPNPPSPEEMRARNARRFPGEWFPEGYDVGEAATTGTASSEPSWISPKGLEAAKEKRIWFDPDHPEFRPAGTFLLNMLVMNEEKHLTRTLPQWAKVIDYWIIGVDEKNTDNSEAIIKKYLGHLPGMIAKVKGFDGHGPTWTTLVDLGIKHFPGATHGIISDADFRPMQDTLDRMSLDIRCSKHMYTIWSSDHRNERKMDWVYRNIPGAKITRRTHQVTEVPIQPDQEVFQTLLPFAVDEQPGGYGDRSGNKEQRYINWMAADLLDFPDDPRALYYLGYGHWDLFQTHGNGPIEQIHRDALDKSIYYFNRRVDLPAEVGNKEERWFALLKLAEMHERYKQDWAKAESYYNRCIILDNERSDPFFYVGQHYRLVGQGEKAEEWLYTAATLPMPSRSLFMWHHLYQCLSKLEYGRAWKIIPTPTLKLTKRAKRILAAADCSSGSDREVQEIKELASDVNVKLAEIRKERKKLLKKRRKEAEKKKKLKEKEEQEAKELQEKEKEQKEEKEEAREEKSKGEEETKKEEKKDKKKKSKKKKKNAVEEDDSDDEVETTSTTSSAPSTPARPSNEKPPPEDILENDTKIPTSRNLMQTLVALTDDMDAMVKKVIEVGEKSDASKAQQKRAEQATNVYAELIQHIQELNTYIDEFEAIKIKGKKTKKSAAREKRAAYLTCQRYRLATTPFLRTFGDKYELIESLLSSPDLFIQSKEVIESARALCR